MSDIVTFLLAIATFAFVAYPLLSRRLRPTPTVTDGSLSELFSKRNTTYSMLKELEFDYNSGILTDEDYTDLKSRYKRKAIDILKGIDDQALVTDPDADLEKEVTEFREDKPASGDADADLEDEVRKLRRGKAATGDVDAELEREVRKLRRGKTAPASVETAPVVDGEVRRGPYCPQCGTRSEVGDRYCTGCGTKLTVRGKE